MVTNCEGQFVLSNCGNGMYHSSVSHITQPHGVRVTPAVRASLQPAALVFWSSQQHDPAGLNDTTSSARHSSQAFHAY